MAACALTLRELVTMKQRDRSVPLPETKGQRGQGVRWARVTAYDAATVNAKLLR
jgi:hypothetical protein